MLRDICKAGRRRRLFAVLALLATGAAHAAEAPREVVKDPLSYSLGQYGLVLGISLLGGLVAWGDKVRRGHIRAWSLMALVGELATASLAGLLCFWACEWAGFAPNLTAALTGLAGYMGTRALALAEKKVEQKFGATGPAPLDDDPPR